MERVPLDANLLPDLLRGLLQNLDPSVIEQLEQLRNNVDPRALMQHFNQILQVLEQNLNSADSQAVAQLWSSLRELIKQQK